MVGCDGMGDMDILVLRPGMEMGMGAMQMDARLGIW